MSKKHHPSAFKFTPAHFFRLAVFTAVMFLSINYLSSRRPISFPAINDPTVLGEETVSSVYNLLPDNSKRTLENLKQGDIIIYLQEKYKYLQDQSRGFPDKQIKEIKKAVIDSVYHDLINNLDSKK